MSLHRGSVCLFPGQGVQFLGMGKYVLDKYPSIANDVFGRANEALKFKISDIMLGTDENLLRQTAICQPAILIHSLAVFLAVRSREKDHFLPIRSMIGHSLGEFTALVASESLSLEDGVQLVRKRGLAMQNVCDLEWRKTPAMCAIIGITYEAASSVFKETQTPENYLCEIASVNADNQIVLSGCDKGVNWGIGLLKKKKTAIKSIPLKVSAPFHTSIMKPAAIKLREDLSQIELKPPKHNIFFNCNGKATTNPEIIKENLIAGVTSTVQWKACLENSTMVVEEEKEARGENELEKTWLEFYEFGSTTLPKLKHQTSKSYLFDF